MCYVFRTRALIIYYTYLIKFVKQIYMNFKMKINNFNTYVFDNLNSYKKKKN